VTQRRGKVTPLVVHEHHPPVVLARVSGTFFGSAGRMKIMETGEREKPDVSELKRRHMTSSTFIFAQNAIYILSR
jgi:hypothetical protein